MLNDKIGDESKTLHFCPNPNPNPETETKTEKDIITLNMLVNTNRIFLTERQITI